MSIEKQNEIISKLNLPESVREVLVQAPSVHFASKIEELEALSCGGRGRTSATVSYELPDGRVIDEADVVKVRNGVSVNYREPYMRRRDPNCMVVADKKPSDKTHFEERFGFSFDSLQKETFGWLAGQDLAVFAFQMGRPNMGGNALAICPANAGFFAFGLGLLQGLENLEELDESFTPSIIIYVAPPFRHTHFDGKQVVVHKRNDIHEIYSYNLYPGPSAKKGVYGALIELGEQEGWVTAHCSAVQTITPYDNITTFMHEGASGGGKSEMLQQPHRMSDGRLLLGRNTVTGEERYLEIPRTCDLNPICDDMGLCHPDLQENDNKLYLTDAENAWFVRVDHIGEYGVDPELERMTIHPDRSLLFLNIDSVAGETSLDLEPYRRRTGPGLPEPAGDHPTRDGEKRRLWQGTDRHPFVRDPHATEHCTKSHLRYPRPVPYPSAVIGLAMAIGLAARFCQPQHRRHRRDGQRRCRQLLAVHAWPTRRAGEPAFATVSRDVVNTICAYSQPAHRRLGDRIHAAVDCP